MQNSSDVGILTQFNGSVKVEKANDGRIHHFTTLTTECEQILCIPYI